MRTASATCHGLTTPLFAILLLLFCCEADLEHSADQDARWLRQIERRWEGNLSGKAFSLTFCEDRRAIVQGEFLEDGCEIDHLVRSDWRGRAGRAAARGCGGCELDVVVLVNALVTTADGQTHAVIDGQLTLGSARDGDLDDNAFTFGCRQSAAASDGDGDLEVDVADADTPNLRGTGALEREAPALASPWHAFGESDRGCDLLAAVEILPSGALSIRGEVLRALGYASVNVPLLHLFPSTSARAECSALR